MHSLFALTILYGRPFVAKQILLGGCVVIFTVLDRYILHDFFMFWVQVRRPTVPFAVSRTALNKFGFKTGWRV